MDSVSKPIVIKNIGKYGISFNFKVKGAAKDVFTIVPDVGTIDPGKDLTVQVNALQGFRSSSPPKAYHVRETPSATHAYFPCSNRNRSTSTRTSP